MADETLVTDEIKAWIGRETPPHSEVIESGMIARWARATFDTSTRFGGLGAPTTFSLGICAAEMGHGDEAQLRPPIKASRSLAGGDEWEYGAPVRPGDTITKRVRVAEIYEKQGSRGPIAFVVWESTFTNQRGEVAVRMRRSSIFLA